MVADNRNDIGRTKNGTGQRPPVRALPSRGVLPIICNRWRVTDCREFQWIA